MKRYSNIPLPTQPFIPGWSSRSGKKAAFFSEAMQTHKILTDENWQMQTDYLYAVDLFNHQFWWEVHEVLEPIWLKQNHVLLKNFLQGLVQISAGLLKHKQCQYLPSQRLFALGCAKLKKVKNIYLGIKIESLIAQTALFLTDSNQQPPVIELTDIGES